MEAAVLPVFEMELNFGQDDPPVRKAEVVENSGVHLRCKIKGKGHDPSTVQWGVDGSELLPKNGVHIHTDRSMLVSDLKLNPVTSGIYECATSSKGKFYKTRLRLTTKSFVTNHTQFGQLLCGPEHNGYCQHNGICVFHPATRVVSCGCTGSYTGRQCEYFNKDIHNIGICDKAQVHLLAQEQYHKSVMLIAGFAGFLVIGLMIAFLLYVKKRDQIKSRFSRRDRTNGFEKASIANFGAQSADQLLQEEVTVEKPGLQIPEFRPSLSMDERIKLIKALVPARCPHCKKTLGINAKLDALSSNNSMSSRNSASLSSSRSDYGNGCGARSVSESHFEIGPAFPNQCRSTPGSCLRVSEFLTPRAGTPSRERPGGISECTIARQISISTPVSPIAHKSLTVTLSDAGKSQQVSVVGAPEAVVISRPVTGIIQEMSVDDNKAAEDSAALLDALQAYRVQKK